MGFWKKALGIGMAAAGVMTANPALVAGGAAVVAGDMQADAAKKAATQQQTAADKAMETQRNAATATQQAYQPYTATGQAALGTLGSLMGLQVPQGGTTVGALPAGTQAAAGFRSDTEEPSGRLAVPREDEAAAPQRRAQLQTQSGYGGGTLGAVAGPKIQMRAPTGEIAFVPAGEVAHYEARGAQRMA